ncbi:MAG: GC-type dockerin domain-anchored protein, partial [Armatimonadota bacterium]|nr:GC-type dockerin domain-anchored protein [Armatimonadota bacterium]
ALYIGLENDRTLLRVNPYTGAFMSAFGYHMCNCFYGHHFMKDGAIRDGEIWRAAPARASGSPGILHVSTLIGVPTNGFYAMEQPHLAYPIGLEWVGEVLMLTTAQGLYRVNFPGEPLVFVGIPYALSGVPSGHQLGGLAYDAQSGTLYLATVHANGASLWRLALNHEAQTAVATLVDTLTQKGYPAGRQPTAMGFVPARAGDANDDGCVNNADLLIVLFAFGTNNSQADLNRDGVVNNADLLLTLFNFGAGC